MSRLYDFTQKEKRQMEAIKPVSRFHDFSEGEKEQIRENENPQNRTNTINLPKKPNKSKK